MGIFGNKKRKLPDYTNVGLDSLLQDPEWAYAISQAGINPASCEVVMRFSNATIGLGISAGPPINPSPSIIFGQGSTLAMAYPTDREIAVVKRSTARAELQTQRSGWFQILFGPANNLDGFMFWGGGDNLQLGTPEGEKFGQVMSAFLKGQLKPGQIVGTPQSLVATAASVEQPAPQFEDPEDALRWKMATTVNIALMEMMDKYQECFKKVDLIERAFGMANAEFVDGIRQHPISKENFRKMAVSGQEELPPLLAELREKTTIAASRWKDLVFLLPGDEGDVIKISNWCMAHGASDMLAGLVGNCMFINTNFGLSRESFLTETARMSAVLSQSDQ